MSRYGSLLCLYNVFFMMLLSLGWLLCFVLVIFRDNGQSTWCGMALLSKNRLGSILPSRRLRSVIYVCLDPRGS